MFPDQDPPAGERRSGDGVPEPEGALASPTAADASTREQPELAGPLRSDLPPAPFGPLGRPLENRSETRRGGKRAGARSHRRSRRVRGLRHHAISSRLQLRIVVVVALVAVTGLVLATVLRMAGPEEPTDGDLSGLAGHTGDPAKSGSASPTPKASSSGKPGKSTEPSPGPANQPSTPSKTNSATLQASTAALADIVLRQSDLPSGFTVFADSAESMKIILGECLTAATASLRSGATRTVGFNRDTDAAYFNTVQRRTSATASADAVTSSRQKAGRCQGPAPKTISGLRKGASGYQIGLSENTSGAMGAAVYVVRYGDLVTSMVVIGAETDVTKARELTNVVVSRMAG